MCVKRTGHRRAKLDKHDFRGIFLGYAATDQNIRYLDLDSGITKVSHHVVFNEAWYSCSDSRPPTAQFLLDYLDSTYVHLYVRTLITLLGSHSIVYTYTMNRQYSLTGY